MRSISIITFAFFFLSLFPACGAKKVEESQTETTSAEVVENPASEPDAVPETPFMSSLMSVKPYSSVQELVTESMSLYETLKSTSNPDHPSKSLVAELTSTPENEKLGEYFPSVAGNFTLYGKYFFEDRVYIVGFFQGIGGREGLTLGVFSSDGSPMDELVLSESAMQGSRNVSGVEGEVIIIEETILDPSGREKKSTIRKRFDPSQRSFVNA